MKSNVKPNFKTLCVNTWVYVCLNMFSSYLNTDLIFDEKNPFFYLTPSSF